MLLSNLEYIPMRLMRKFLFRDAFLLRFGRLVPYYRINRNQADPRPLVDDYVRYLTAQNTSPAGQRVLEVGVGATNSTGYEFAAACSPAGTILLEPFVAFSPVEDRALLEKIAARRGIEPARLQSAVRRVSDLATMPDASVDLVLSSSVLEHVSHPKILFRHLHRVLKPTGAMLHLVDYRDHFFKYPYHFLQFSRSTWERWLDPGDLPRWRVSDHLQLLAQAQFTTELLHTVQDPVAFARVAPHLSPDFSPHDPLLPIGQAVIWAKPVG